MDEHALVLCVGLDFKLMVKVITDSYFLHYEGIIRNPPKIEGYPFLLIDFVDFGPTLF